METRPLSFLADVPRGSHLVLYHEQEGLGEILEFWYLLHGLIKGESAIYLTTDDPEKIRQKMRNRRIDVDYFENDRGQLHLIKFNDPAEHPGGFEEGMREMYRAAFDGVKSPFRVVGASVPEIKTEDQIKRNIEVESGAMRGFERRASKGSVYSVFDNFQGSVLCHYSLSDNLSGSQSRWMAQNQSYHHASIVASNAHELAVILGGGAQ